MAKLVATTQSISKLKTMWKAQRHEHYIYILTKNSKGKKGISWEPILSVIWDHITNGHAVIDLSFRI